MDTREKDNAVPGPSRLFAFIRKEPLVHFLALAALLFAANALFSADDREAITIDAATREYLIEQQQELLLRPMTDREKDEVIKSFIEEEILVREARKRGFENSSRIRALLIQNMRFFMASEIPKPTREDLQEYFEDNAERFRSASSVTFDHTFFLDARDVPEDALERLRAGADHKSLGNTASIGATLPYMREPQVVQAFGRKLAPDILAINDDQWHGPFESPHGVHFLRIAVRNPGKMPSFEEADNWVEQEWILEKNREIVEREIASVRDNYRIELPGREGSSE